jgi:ABC-type antimicrobial peptide transport system permease subunit
MQELIPVGCGLLLGAALGYIRPSMQLPIGAALAIVLGVCATVVTGEFKLSWDYVLVDIPLVALATFLSLVTVRRVAPAWRSR